MKLSEVIEAIKSNNLEIDIDRENTGVFIGVAKGTGPQTINFNGTVQGEGKVMSVMIAYLMMNYDDFRESMQNAMELYFKLRKEKKDEE